SASFVLTNFLPNHPPTASISGPAVGVRGQSLAFTLGADDPDAGDNAAGFTFAVNWGDSSPIEVVGPGAASGATIAHTFSTNGTFTVTVTAADTHGLVGPGGTASVSINAVQFANGTLSYGGTNRNDNITFWPQAGGIQVYLNGIKQGSFTGVTRLVAYGQGGNDQIAVYYTLRQPAEFYGGAGNDRLYGGAGNDLLFGGDGDDW